MTFPKKKIVFAATTPFAVNAFLTSHLLVLAKKYDVLLCVNLHAYALTPALENRVRVFHIGFERKIAPIKDLRALSQLLWVLWCERPYVFHSITPKAGLLAMFAAFLLGVPHRYHTFTGQVWVNSRGLPRLILKSVDRWIVRFATRVLADSTSQCRLLVNEKIVQVGGVSVLGPGSISGVDLSRFRPDSGARLALRTELGVSNDNLSFIFVGRLVRDKGVFDLVEAFALVNAQHPKWELWMVGPDEDGIQADLTARSVHLGARTRWLGSTPCPERYMAAADVFVLPSYREGFGSVVIEAAACGVPCIAYRIDGVIDAIIENRTGVLVDKGNVHGLADSISQLGSDQQMRRALGEAARLRAVNEFSSSAVSSAWQEFYSAVFDEMA